MDHKFLGKTCPYCKTPFEKDDVVVICSICDMPHHLSCWQENNGCTTFGCTGNIKETFGEASAAPQEKEKLPLSQEVKTPSIPK